MVFVHFVFARGHVNYDIFAKMARLQFALQPFGIDAFAFSGDVFSDGTYISHAGIIAFPGLTGNLGFHLLRRRGRLFHYAYVHERAFG